MIEHHFFLLAINLKSNNKSEILKSSVVYDVIEADRKASRGHYSSGHGFPGQGEHNGAAFL